MNFEIGDRVVYSGWPQHPATVKEITKGGKVRLLFDSFEKNAWQDYESGWAPVFLVPLERPSQFDPTAEFFI